MLACSINEKVQSLVTFYGKFIFFNLFQEKQRKQLSLLQRDINLRKKALKGTVSKNGWINETALIEWIKMCYSKVHSYRPDQKFLILDQATFHNKPEVVDLLTNLNTILPILPDSLTSIL